MNDNLKNDIEKETNAPKQEAQVISVLSDEVYKRLVEDLKGKTKRAKQVRSCEMVSTIKALSEIFDCDEGSVAKVLVEKIVKAKKMFKHHAFIIHDKDRDELTDELKEKHIHCVLELNYPCTLSQVAKKIGVAPNFISYINQTKLYGDRRVSDIGGALSYLTHRNAPEKHQYDDSEVIVSDGWDWKKVRALSEDVKMNSELGDLYEKIIRGEIKEFEIPDKIDANIYIKNKSKIDKAFEYKRMIDVNNHSRNTECIYIYGPAGCGKTTIAKRFCENLGLNYFITGGSRDPFDGYAGEECVIMDDARSNYFDAQEWLKILDKNTASKASSRFHDKYINAKYIILTSTKTINEFVYSFYDEEYAQFYRRLSIYIEVTKEEIYVKEYDSQIRDYKEIGKMENPITKMYGLPFLTNDKKNEILKGLTFEGDGKDNKPLIEIADDDLHFKEKEN